MDQTQLPPDGGQPSDPEDRQSSDALPAASPMQTPTSKEHDDFPEDALLEDEAAGWSAQFVVPFQQSGPTPAVNPQTARASTNQAGAPAQGHTTPRRVSPPKVALISALIVLAVAFPAPPVFAQPAAHPTTTPKIPTQSAPVAHSNPA